MSWNEIDDERLTRLAKSGKVNYVEIAQLLKRKQGAVRWRARKRGLPNHPKTIKHEHPNTKYDLKLKFRVFKYYMRHTHRECAKKFNLDEREIKSLLTNGYKDERFDKFRKDTRTHEALSANELQTLLTHSGLVPQKELMRKLGRGKNFCHIKERLHRLGLASRNLQGLTLSQYKEAFGKRPDFFIQTRAGPRRKSASFTLWKIVPWVYLNEEVRTKRLRTAQEMKLLVQTQAEFQRWIFGGGNVISKMKKIVGEISR